MTEQFTLEQVASNIHKGESFHDFFIRMGYPEPHASVATYWAEMDKAAHKVMETVQNQQQ